MDYFIEFEGKRVLAKSPDHIPRVGEHIYLTQYGRVRAFRVVVQRVEWTIVQEESPAYYNRPRQVVLFVEAAELPPEV